MKKLLLGISLFILNSGIAQLKVVPSGIVGIGSSTPNGNYSLTLDNGSSKGIVHYRYGEGFRAGSAGGAGVVGSSADQIDFWYSSATGHNQIVVQGVSNSSDRNLKTNIRVLDGGLDNIMKLKPFSYQFKTDLEQRIEKERYGFMTQDVIEVIPNLVDSSKGFQTLNYIEIIPFLVKGMQEQQKLIDYQKKKIDEIEEEMAKLTSGKQESDSKPEDSFKGNSTLFQNVPNPFREKTKINFEISKAYTEASIMIFDLKGTSLKAYDLDKNGENFITIEAKELKAGMYVYSLIVDGIEVDSKKMILER